MKNYDDKKCEISVDKIKIAFIGIHQENLDMLISILQNKMITYRRNISQNASDCFLSGSLSKCRYNFTFRLRNDAKGVEGTLYVGVSANWITNGVKKESKNVIIEFNPNKINLKKTFLYYEVIKKGLLKCLEHYIVNMDIACDYRFFSMSDIIGIDKVDIRNKEIRISHKMLETIYIGEENENGRVKIYDKSLEQKIKGKWTRYEITYRGDLGALNDLDWYYRIIETKLPIVRYGGVKCELNIKDIEKYNDDDIFKFRAVLNDYEMKNMLPYRKRKKIEEMMDLFVNKINIDKQNLVNAVCLCLKSNFNIDYLILTK